MEKHPQWIGLMLMVLAVSLVAGCGGNKPPTAEIRSPSMMDSVCCAGREIAFQGKGEDPEGEELTYRWDFGDEKGKSTEQNPKYVYEKPGTYIVTLTVSDGSYTVNKHIQIRVLEPPPPPEPLDSGAVYVGLALWHAAGKVSVLKEWREFREFVGQTQTFGDYVEGLAKAINSFKPETHPSVIRREVTDELTTTLGMALGLKAAVVDALKSLKIETTALSDEDLAKKVLTILADSADNPLYKELLAAGLPVINKAELQEINNGFRRIRVKLAP